MSRSNLCMSHVTCHSVHVAILTFFILAGFSLWHFLRVHQQSESFRLKEQQVRFGDCLLNILSQISLSVASAVSTNDLGLYYHPSVGLRQGCDLGCIIIHQWV